MILHEMELENSRRERMRKNKGQKEERIDESQTQRIVMTIFNKLRAWREYILQALSLNWPLSMKTKSWN